jgi:hypothetical protein
VKRRTIKKREARFQRAWKLLCKQATDLHTYHHFKGNFTFWLEGRVLPDKSEDKA